MRKPSLRRRHVPAVTALASLAIAGCGGAAKVTTPTTTAVDIATPTAATQVIHLQSLLSSPLPRASATSSPGSQIVFFGSLFHSSASTALGRYQGSCVRTAPGDGEVFQCLLTYVLPRGVIYAQSLASSQGPAEGAVTGGTGAYTDLRGTFHYRSTGNPRVDLTLILAG